MGIWTACWEGEQWPWVLVVSFAVNVCGRRVGRCGRPVEEAGEAVVSFNCGVIVWRCVEVSTYPDRVGDVGFDHIVGVVHFILFREAGVSLGAGPRREGVW